MAEDKTPEQVREEQISRILKRMEEKLRRDLVLGPQPYDDIERQAQEIGEELKRTIEDEVAESCGIGYAGSRLRCNCGRSARYKGKRTRELVSLSGSHRLLRAYYHCPFCLCGWCPLDRVLGLVSGHATTRVRALVARFCGYLPYRIAGMELEAICGIRLAPSTIEHYAQAVGRRIQEHWKEKEEKLWAGCGTGSNRRPKQVHLAMDGAIIFVDGEWREAKLGCIYERQGENGVGWSDYYATLENSALFGKRMKTLAYGAGLDRCHRVGVVSDGAAWIWQETGKHFPRSVQILDYYHVTEHLWQVANAWFGPQTPAAANWIELQKQRLLSNKVAAVIKDIDQWQVRTLADRDVKRKTIDYLTNHEHRMQYETFQAQGWHIGSGIIEAGCKCVVKSRLGGAGMRWSAKGAEAILHVTAAWRSSQQVDFKMYAH